MGNSIEEDIKILEELRIANENCIKNAKNKDNPFVAIWEKQNIALEHILSDYKRVLKENEELKTELERQKDINSIISQKGLEKNYEKALEKTMTKFLKNNMDNDFVPVQKVKDKIEELKKQDKKWTEELSEPDSNFKIIDRNLKRIKNQIESLQELIEVKGKE